MSLAHELQITRLVDLGIKILVNHLLLRFSQGYLKKKNMLDPASSVMNSDIAQSVVHS